MKKNLYLLILKKLSKKGVGHPADISELFIKDPFERVFENGDFIGSNAGWNMANRFLEKMKSNNDIEFFNIYTKQQSSNGTANWVPLDIEAEITTKGLDYYKKNRKSLIPFWIEVLPVWIKRLGSILTIILGLIALYDRFNKHNAKNQEKKQSNKTQIQSNHTNSTPTKLNPKPSP